MTTFRQTYLNGKKFPTTLTWSHWSESEDSVAGATVSPQDVIGLSAHVSAKGKLEFVAISIHDKITVFDATKETSDALRRVLAGDLGRVVAFGIVGLVIHIRHALGLDVRGYNLPPEGDVSSSYVSPGAAARELFGSGCHSSKIDEAWDFCIDDDEKKLEYLCIRAWVTERLSQSERWSTPVAASRGVRTNHLNALKEFKHISSMVREQHLIDVEKPCRSESEFNSVTNTRDGFIVHNERYKTRIRKSEKSKTQVVLRDANGKTFHGKVGGVNGKQTTVRSIKAESAAEIKRVSVVGREELNYAEKAREVFLLQLLQGVRSLSNSLYPFIGHIWFPDLKRLNRKHIKNARIRIGQADRPLNQSQANVVEAMINPHRSIVITHGPPGTGKTTTISVAMREIQGRQGMAWIVAQSNVGVKNIAESLCKHCVDFKLIVSNEFYYEWHDHIYAEVNDHLILTNKLREGSAKKLIQGARLVLCTVSMLSNPDLTRVFRLVPMRMLVVDEASQVGIFNYLHIFGRFKELEKVCFFGDPKQLPPFGRESASTLQSVFDLSHLKSSAYFLDTQYRMPNEVGGFISRAVYQSKLKSVHPVDGWGCLKFIDVWNGSEQKDGKSWRNGREVQTIIHLVQHYYRHREYCIITPYDAQRNAIQKALKKAGLPWGNVFNVDSFQGNEAEYVLVSVVRTSAPGFLRSQNRVNVMLTRCKKGMVIVSKREFMRRDGVRKTLLGKLALHWEEKAGRSNAWCKWVDVAEKKAVLPGATVLQS